MFFFCSLQWLSISDLLLNNKYKFRLHRVLVSINEIKMTRDYINVLGT